MVLGEEEIEDPASIFVFFGVGDNGLGGLFFPPPPPCPDFTELSGVSRWFVLPPLSTTLTTKMLIETQYGGKQ